MAPSSRQFDENGRDSVSDDSVSQLLDAVLAEPAAGRRELLDSCCASHPEVASTLRARFEALESFGLVDGDDDTLEQGTRIGPFEIVERIGAGGMGVVYRAIQHPLERRVALKVVRPEFATLQRQRQRFFREAEIVGSLDHPHIVPVHAAGEAEGAPYIAMGFVDGITLAELIDALKPSKSQERLLDVLRRRFPQLDAEAIARRIGDPDASWERVVAALLAPIADALAHAHSRGVVHRDVKPTNVMFDADGRPMLLDFGLARADTATSLTRTGALIGSAPYMAPEQVRGDRIDARADLFAFGSVLYELANLEPAFDARSAEVAMREIVSRDPRLLRGRSTGERELIAVLAKCLEKDPRARYASADDLRADLLAVAANRPVSVRPFTWYRRAARFARREPARAAWMAACAVAVLAVVMLAGFMLGQRDEVVAGRARIAALARDEQVSRAYVALVHGEFDSARSAFGQVAARWPDHVDGRLGLALVARDWDALPDDISRADREFLAAVRLGPPPHADLETAVLHAQSAIAFAPSVRRLYQIGLAISAGRAGDATAARTAAGSLAELWPDSAAAAYWAGYALLECDPHAAIVHLERAIRIDPEFARAHASRGTAAAGVGDLDGAIESLERSRDLAPAIARTRVTLGVLLQRANRIDEAVTELRRATELDPGLPGAHFALGNALHATDRSAAEAAFEAAVNVGPTYARAWSNLGSLRLERDALDAAVTAFRRVTELTPDDADSFRDLAFAHARSGTARQAALAYQRVVELAPDSREDHDYLCSLLEHLGDTPALDAERARFAAHNEPK